LDSPALHGRTLHLREAHAELIAFFEDAAAALLDEVVKALGKVVHASAQVVEAKVQCR